jgi:hypothetical protein
VRSAPSQSHPVGLAERQAPDGSWSSDVYATSLVLLALLGEGRPSQAAHVDRGVQWLLEQQDEETGALAPRARDHAAATLALCEATYFARKPEVRRGARAALGRLTRTHTEDAGAWSGWGVLALVSARDGELEVDEAAMESALRWVEGRTAEDGATALAMGLLARCLLGQRPEDHPSMLEHAEHLLAHPPHWGPKPDLELWFFGSLAAYQLGSSTWKQWREHMQILLRAPDEVSASDDASDAVLALCLQVHACCARTVGAR